MSGHHYKTLPCRDSHDRRHDHEDIHASFGDREAPDSVIVDAEGISVPLVGRGQRSTHEGSSSSFRATSLHHSFSEPELASLVEAEAAEFGTAPAAEREAEEASAGSPRETAGGLAANTSPRRDSTKGHFFTPPPDAPGATQKSSVLRRYPKARSAERVIEQVEFLVAYSNGQRAECSVQLQDADTWGWGKEARDRFLWLGLRDPCMALMQMVAKVAGLHELLIEDAMEGDPRPKLEVYEDGTVFVTLRTVWFQNDRAVFGDVDVIMNPNLIISISQSSLTLAPFRSIQARVERTSELLKAGPCSVLVAIIHWAIESSVSVVIEINEDLEEVNEQIFSPEGLSPEGVKRLYFLRRDSIGMKRAVSPLVDICNRLLSDDLKAYFPGQEPYLRNLFYNSLQLRDDVEALMVSMGHAFDASTMIDGANVNKIQKKLAAYGAILLVPTFLAGVFGMNFAHMPLITGRDSFWIFVGIVVTIVSLMWTSFYRARWI